MSVEAGRRKMMMKHRKKYSKKPSRSGDVTCKMADSKAAYYYQRMATAYATEIDNVANENPEDLSAWYKDNVEVFNAKDVKWEIIVPGTSFPFAGNEELFGFFTFLVGRRFSFNQWSNFEVNVCDDYTVKVNFLYASVVLEAEGNYIDYFGEMEVAYDHYDKVSYLRATRTYAIDRGYGE